jgi:hypothetical protein
MSQENQGVIDYFNSMFRSGGMGRDRGTAHETASEKITLSPEEAAAEVLKQRVIALLTIIEPIAGFPAAQKLILTDPINQELLPHPLLAALVKKLNIEIPVDNKVGTVVESTPATPEVQTNESLRKLIDGVLKKLVQILMKMQKPMILPKTLF